MMNMIKVAKNIVALESHCPRLVAFLLVRFLLEKDQTAMPEYTGYRRSIVVVVGAEGERER